MVYNDMLGSFSQDSTENYEGHHFTPGILSVFLLEIVVSHNDAWFFLTWKINIHHI